ncbi:hypothetical protein NH44784_041101 [Achromobacter xylosoxidans NH44784-1996]|nr:hypothetical protein NH44784_041101 [Achromobacter xylosoxidans NH44784-1996]
MPPVCFSRSCEYSTYLRTIGSVRIPRTPIDSIRPEAEPEEIRAKRIREETDP